jgi:glycosyltransferase involved in cell wall biosynthesis
VKPTVSCLIPAYNEERYLAEVLKVSSTYPGFDQVIVIDDGSTDKTSEIIAEFPVTHLKNSKNQGKTAAILTGLDKATGDIICLLDADLSGLSDENLDQLLQPHYKQTCLTMSLRGNAWTFTAATGIDPLSGERAAPKEIFTKYLSQHLDAGYALELLINQAAIEEKLPIYSVNWKNVKYYPKIAKQNPLNGIKGEFEMFYSITSYFGWKKTIQQQLLFIFFHFKYLQKNQLTLHLDRIKKLSNEIHWYENNIINKTQGKIQAEKWLQRLKKFYPLS